MALIAGPPTINTEELMRVLELAGLILECFPGYEGHQHGGVLCVADNSTGLPLLTCVFGCITIEEHEACMGFALEKARRLAENPLHFTSFESRDMDAVPKRYGSAIRGRKFILSFSSGSKEEQDEVAMLLLELMLIGGIDEAPRWLAERTTTNPYFAELQCGVAF